LSDHTLQGVDVAVEFTSPDAAPENIRRLAAMGVNSVSGTTGWFGDLPSVREAVAKSGTGLVWAPNFSVGVIFSCRPWRTPRRFLRSTRTTKRGAGKFTTPRKKTRLRAH